MNREILCSFILGAVCAPAAAVPVLNPSNSHYYELILVPDPYSGINNHWATASAAAAASVHLGVAGHLATVTSQAENDFLFGLVNPAPAPTAPFAGAWLGGNATHWLVGPEAGQALTYPGWDGSEPNNAGLMYMNIGGSFAGIDPGRWADDSGDQGVPVPGVDPVIGYFVEYEPPQQTPASAPVTLALLGIGLLAMRTVRRASLRR